MESKQLINKIKNSPKQTPAILYFKLDPLIENLKVYDQIMIDDLANIFLFLEQNINKILSYQIEVKGRNVALDLLDLKRLDVRVEYGAIIREQVYLGENCVILMGAIINIGAQIGANTMIDMGAVIGSRAIIGANCHIGANAVIAGALEPISLNSVRIENNVLVGANAVILEGLTIGENSVIGAGAIVTKDVPKNSVVYGNPAKFIKFKDEKITNKTKIEEELRQIK